MTDLAVAADGWRAASRRALRPFYALKETVDAEGERRILWLPVFFGTGIALYFTLTVEPPRWAGLLATAAAVLLTFALRRRAGWREAAITLAFAAAGFAAIQQSRVEHGAPVLERRIGSLTLTGKVIDIDQLDRGWRIVIAPDPLPGIEPDAQPRQLRVRIPPTSDTLQPGDRVDMRARLYPPPAQVVPGGWDLQRALYFAEIGGVGYSFGPAHRIAAPRDGGWREWLLRLRNDMTQRITSVLPGSTGGIAAALITGKRGAIAEDVNQAFRDFGAGTPAGDFGHEPSGGGRFRLSDRARRAGADPVCGAALSDQEDRRLGDITALNIKEKPFFQRKHATEIAIRGVFWGAGRQHRSLQPHPPALRSSRANRDRASARPSSAQAVPEQYEDARPREGVEWRAYASGHGSGPAAARLSASASGQKMHG